MLKRTKAAMLFTLVLSIPVILFAEQDPFIGSWKHLKENNINKYEDAGGGKLKVTVLRVDDQGKPNSHSRIEVYDGKPHTIVGEDGTFGTVPTDAISVRRINSHRIDGENWFQGKVRARFVVTVSPDGKTLTKSVKGVKNGVPYEDVRVSNRVE